MPMESNGRDLYVRQTDVNGKASVRMERVWDAERFLAARQRDCEKANNEQKPGEPRKAAIEQITRDQFNKQRGRTQ